MSNILKSEIKIGTAQEIGVRIDDLLEETMREVDQAAGAHTAFIEAAKAVAKLHTHVDADLETETYALDVGARIKQYITRATVLLENLAQQTSNIHKTALGKKQAFEKTIQSIKTFQDHETTKLKATLATQQSTSETSEAVKQELPRKLSIKEQRLAEEKIIQNTLLTSKPLPVAAITSKKPKLKAKK